MFVTKLIINIHLGRSSNYAVDKVCVKQGNRKAEHRVRNTERDSRYDDRDKHEYGIQFMYDAIDDLR